MVYIVAHWSSRHPSLMHLLRCLFFPEVHFCFTLSLVHVAGVANTLAGDLSRNNVPSFVVQGPAGSSHTHPSPIDIATDGHQCIMDTTRLDSAVHYYSNCKLIVAKSTASTYGAAVFCATFHVLHPFPEDGLLLCLIIVALAKEGLAPTTLRTYLSNIHHTQIMWGLPEMSWSGLPCFNLLQSGMAHDRVKTGVVVSLGSTFPLLRSYFVASSRCGRGRQVAVFTTRPCFQWQLLFTPSYFSLGQVHRTVRGSL